MPCAVATQVRENAGNRPDAIAIAEKNGQNPASLRPVGVWGRRAVTFAMQTMHRAVARILTVFAVLALVAGPTALQASAASKFDGDWKIYIFGGADDCRFGYRLPITISNGDVLYKGRKVHPAVIGVNAASGAVAIHLGNGRNIVKQRQQSAHRSPSSRVGSGPRAGS